MPRRKACQTIACIACAWRAIPRSTLGRFLRPMGVCAMVLFSTNSDSSGPSFRGSNRIILDPLFEAGFSSTASPTESCVCMILQDPLFWADRNLILRVCCVVLCCVFILFSSFLIFVYAFLILKLVIPRVVCCHPRVYMFFSPCFDLFAYLAYACVSRRNPCVSGFSSPLVGVSSEELLLITPPHSYMWQPKHQNM